jgi:hypothetical protein
MKLIYVNELGPNYLGNNVYEFIFGFSDSEPFGEGWETVPASGNALPPEIEYIKKVGVLKESSLKLHLIQNSDYFCVYDAVEEVIALGWEDADTEEVVDQNKTRLVFKYGETLEVVKDKLYERDLVLEFDKMTNLINENEE